MPTRLELRPTRRPCPRPSQRIGGKRDERMLLLRRRTCSMSGTAGLGLQAAARPATPASDEPSRCATRRRHKVTASGDARDRALTDRAADAPERCACGSFRSRSRTVHGQLRLVTQPLTDHSGTEPARGHPRRVSRESKRSRTSGRVPAWRAPDLCREFGALRFSASRRPCSLEGAHALHASSGASGDGPARLWAGSARAPLATPPPYAAKRSRHLPHACSGP